MVVIEVAAGVFMSAGLTRKATGIAAEVTGVSVEGLEGVLERLLS